MCQFCNLIKQNSKVNLLTRGFMAEDNLCEYVNNDNCELCEQCLTEFSLNFTDIELRKFMNVDFKTKVIDDDGTEVIVDRFTELYPFNYCFVCGEKFSDDINNNRLDYLLDDNY